MRKWVLEAMFLGQININLSELIDRKTLRFMSEASGFGYIAAQEALLNASLNLEEMNTSRIGIVAGSGGASSAAQIEASDVARERGPKRIGPYAVTKTMGSTVSAILGTTLKLKRSKLFNIIRMLNQCSLHWSCSRTYSIRQTRHHYCWWCRTRALDLVLHV